MCQNDTCEDTRGPLAVADTFTAQIKVRKKNIVQELCESRGGRPGLSILTSLLVSMDVKLY